MGHYKMGFLANAPIQLRNTLNAGHVEIEELTPDMTNYCGGIIGSANFRRLRTRDTVIENCYSIDSGAILGIGDDSRGQLTKRITLLR
jgi:hypothetical protein